MTLNDVIWFDRDGLHLGCFDPMQIPVSNRADAGERLRVETMLAIAFRKRLTPYHLEAISKAATISRDGNQALANIRLAMSGLILIDDPHGLSDPLATAEVLMAEGILRPTFSPGLTSINHAYQRAMAMIVVAGQTTYLRKKQRPHEAVKQHRASTVEVTLRPNL